MTYTLFKHQHTTVAFLAKIKAAMIGSDPGCVSCDTEYLTPTGWKRIDNYTIGDKIAQWLPNTKQIEFITPIDYIKLPCKELYYIHPTRGTSQKLSSEHRVLYYKKDNSYSIISANEFVNSYINDDYHRKTPGFETVGTLKTEPTSIYLSNAILRIQIAILADGYFPPKRKINTCIIRIKKERKIKRLHKLLTQAGINYTCQPALPLGFKRFTFIAPVAEKQYNTWWWTASTEQLKLITNEVMYWDGSIAPQTSKRFGRYTSTHKQDIDFIQYAFIISGLHASIHKDIRPTKYKNAKQICYNLTINKQNTLKGPGRNHNTKVVPTEDGYKYCFTSPSSFLFLRHNGHTFATGNTGKTLCIIEDIQHRLNANPMSKTLIIAPKSILFSAWQDDILKFAPHIRTSVATAPAAKRKAAFEKSANVYITNTDAVKWLDQQQQNDPLFFQNFETIIVDESGFFMNSSARTKALLKIRQHFKYARAMNGTLIGGPITNLYYQYFFLTGSQDVGISFNKFRNMSMIAYSKPNMPQYSEWKNKPGIEKVMAKMLAHLTIRHALTDVVDMPARLEYTYKYTPNAKVKKAYAQMKSIARIELEDHRKNKTKISAVNASATIAKLLQICIEASTEILTIEGWKEIQHMHGDEQVWDGYNWVNYDRVLDKGYQPTVKCKGIDMTKNHKLLTLSGWCTAEEIINGKSSKRFNRSNFQFPNGYWEGRFETNWTKNKLSSIMGLSLYLRQFINTFQSKYKTQTTKKQKLWLQTWTWNDNPWRKSTTSTIQSLDKDKTTLQQHKKQRLQKLWCTWSKTKQNMGKLSNLCKRYVPNVQTWFNLRQKEQQSWLLQKQLQMVYSTGTNQQHTYKCIHRNTERKNDYSQCSKSIQFNLSNTMVQSKKSPKRKMVQTIKHVYDLYNVGPNNCFLIRNKQGYEILSHNCAGSILDEKRDYVLVDAQRFDLVIDLILQYKNNKPLVTFNYTSQRIYMMAMAEKAGLKATFIDGSVSAAERNIRVQDFQKGIYDAMFLQPMAASHGLTLTASTCSIWSVPIYRGDIYTQLQARNYRIGQKERVTTIHVQAKGTLEADVYRKLKGKVSSIDLLNEALKE